MCVNYPLDNLIVTVPILLLITKLLDCVLILFPQTLWGDIGPASRTLQKYHSVWRHFGFIPEFYQIASGEPYSGRAGYPLRPGGIKGLHKKNSQLTNYQTECTVDLH